MKIHCEKGTGGEGKKETHPIPDSYKKVKFYNWNGIYYYNNVPLEEVKSMVFGSIIDTVGDRCAHVEIHDTGYIDCDTMGGKVYLKIPNWQSTLPDVPKEVEEAISLEERVADLEYQIQQINALLNL